jgi:hypothetical protein
MMLKELKRWAVLRDVLPVWCVSQDCTWYSTATHPEDGRRRPKHVEGILKYNKTS